MWSVLKASWYLVASLAVFLVVSILGVLGTLRSATLPVENKLWLCAGWLSALAIVVALVCWKTMETKRGMERLKKEQEAVQPLAESAARVAVAANLNAERAQTALMAARAGTDPAALAAATTDAAGTLVVAVDTAARAEKAIAALPDADGALAGGSVQLTLIMNIIVFIISGLLVVSFWTAGGGQRWSASMIWSCTCLIIGVFAGFLFGLPRARGVTTTTQSVANKTPAVQQGNQPAPVPAIQTTSTSQESPIEQMADWLTKTIVGVALVNLKTIPGLLHQWSVVVSRSVSDLPGPIQGNPLQEYGPIQSFVLGFLLYFVLVGFLSGYLLTQFFLLNYVNRDRA
jgi:hypothetical protein